MGTVLIQVGQVHGSQTAMVGTIDIVALPAPPAKIWILWTWRGLQAAASRLVSMLVLNVGEILKL